jgi:hypothetical protein
MKVLLANEQDATGAPVTVWHSDNVGQNLEVAGMYLRATAFLMDKGWAMAPFNLVQNGHRVIWVESEEGVPMGGVIYEYHAHNKQGWIVLIFTDEQFRGRHVYSILQKHLEEVTIQNGGTSIASLAHKDNVARLKAGAREGMHPQFLRLYKDLTPNISDIKQAMVDRRGKPWSDINLERWAYGPGGSGGLPPGTQPTPLK